MTARGLKEMIPQATGEEILTELIC